MTILGPESVAGSKRIPATKLTEFSTQMFQVAGLYAPDAATAAAVLINADPRGDGADLPDDLLYLRRYEARGRSL